MSYELLGILISVLVTVVIQAICVIYKIGRMTEKLENLEKKQDKYNGIIEKTYKHESQLARIWQKLDDL